MKNKRILIISIILCLICLTAAVLIGIKNGKDEYDVVIIGDSIMAGEYNAPWNISALIETNTEFKVLNGAFGGTCLSQLASDKLTGDMTNLFLGYRIAEAMGNHDFSLQVLGSQKENNTAYEHWYDVATNLQNADWKSVKYILIEHGANDYINGVIIENPDDKYDVSTFAGALRSSIENIHAGVPNAQIILVTPIYMNPDGLDGDCYEVDYGGGYLEDYVNAEIEVAAEYGLTVIDDFHEVDINKDNYEEYIPGGLHGNLEGNTLIAENISKHLKELDGLN